MCALSKHGCSMKKTFKFLFALALLSLPLAASATDKLAPINHIIVIYLENHSFDNLFGTFPGADGIANNKNPQTQADGDLYDTLPQPVSKKGPDTRFPSDLANTPFPITRYVGYDQLIADPVHRFYQTQQQINRGRMDKFVEFTNVGGLVMGYYAEQNSPLWQYARKYALADHFFTAVYGGSLINHLWLVCACIPHYENAPAEMLAQLDKNGKLLRDGELTPQGDLVNNIQPFGWPYDPQKVHRPEQRLPAQTLPTIGDRLSEKNISWAWYSGGWDEAITGKLGSFVPHHQPFIYFKNYGENTQGRTQHLKDEADFMAAIKVGTLPAVSYYKPIGKFDLHPGYSAPKESEEHAFEIIKAIEASPLWKDSLIIVTFDDSGGFYDHVAPPKRDRFGPGIRVPTLIISPFAKQGFIDRQNYDSTSILKLIEKKFGLKPLAQADKNAPDLTNMLQ